MRVVYDYPVSKGNHNLAMLKGRFIQPSEFADKIIQGFESAYLGAMENTETLLRIIQQYGELEVRYLIRNTQQYAIVLSSSYAYICFSLLIKADFNAVICAVLLLLLIWAMDYLFSLCFKKNDLGISEKKRYIFMAYVGACISGFIIASRDASKMALEIPNITISVLIGAYVPFTLLLEDGKKGKVELQSMKEEWEEKYKKTFRERKVKDILSALLFAMVYGVLLVGALSPAQNIINDIASGIGMGMATVVVAFVGLVEVKNRLTKRRNKREDADQEKSDTE